MSKFTNSIVLFLCLFMVTPLCHAGLVGHWSFDKDDIVKDRAIDRSGKGHDGIIHEASPVAGKIGQALKFDGRNSCVNVDGLILQSPELSVSLWIKNDTLSGVRRLVFFDGLLQVGLTNRTLFVHTFTIRGEDANRPYFDTQIVADKWYHLVVTWNTVAASENVKIYLDGELKAHESLARSRGGKLGIIGLTIGRLDLSSNPGDVFDGAIDEVRLYDTAVTGPQVKRLYQGKHIGVLPPTDDVATNEGKIDAVHPSEVAALRLLKRENRAKGKKLLRVASELVSGSLDVPSMAEADLPEKVKAWQQTGLDGLVFNVARHDKVKGPQLVHGLWWDITPLEYNQFIPEIKAFQEVNDWGRLSDNFLWSSVAVWGSTTCQDWFNDEHWKVVLNNVRIQAKVAKECGFKGILLDTEQYLHHGRGPWRLPFSYKYYAITGGYELAGEAKPRSFARCAAKVRRRAKQYAEAISDVYPDITLFVIPGLHECALPHGSRVQDDNMLVYHNDHALYPAFCDGLLLGLNERATIVAATESTYDKSQYRDMLVARDASKQRSLTLSTVPELARKRISFSVGVWADAGRRWSDTDVSVNQRDPESHAHAVHNALAASDHYAWLYGEQSKFLTTRPSRLMHKYFEANIKAHETQDLFWKPTPIPKGLISPR